MPVNPNLRLRPRTLQTKLPLGRRSWQVCSGYCIFDAATVASLNQMPSPQRKQKMAVLLAEKL